MSYQIKSEEELLNPAVRKKIIESIEGAENRARKDNMFKRYQCYKDQTFLYVRNELLKQFDRETVNEMSYALSNIAFIRKAIDKLARVYKYGVDREVYADDKQLDEATEALKKAVDELDANAKMKKCNRYFKLFKNTAFYVRPKPCDEEGKFTIKMDPLPPYLYDVVEVHGEREKPMAFILSDFNPSDDKVFAIEPGTDGRSIASQVKPLVRLQGDNVDQPIADSPGDEKGPGYVFWSKKYHFVCNEKGEIIDGPDDQANPIGELPFVNFAEDQDGSFWAIGGDDLTDGSILINSMLTNILHIGITQGYGQLVMTGKDLPLNIKVGPNKGIRLPQEEGDPTPTFDFKSANPPLSDLRGLVEMYVALLLTTNNLSTSGVQANLNGAAAFPSGIAMMIDKAESMEDVDDQRQIFIDNEPLIWGLYERWHDLLSERGELSEHLVQAELPQDFDLRIKFGQPKAIQSEKEMLEVLKMKKDMGIISMIDMIKAEHPDLSDEEAESKLKQILEEKMQQAQAFVMGGGEQNEGNKQQDDQQRDERDDRPGDEEPERGNEDGDRGVPGRADSAERGE